MPYTLSKNITIEDLCSGNRPGGRAGGSTSPENNYQNNCIILEYFKKGEKGVPTLMLSRRRRCMILNVIRSVHAPQQQVATYQLS